ncbi:MAG: hypothetical protein H8D92_00450 [Pelagibacteraceae bacterium]|nr:hypothetical protein [Pelagibacteraceae bacterium]
MNGFEVYKIYLAIKLHFTSKNQSYDFHKHNGRTTARLETFTKRRDRYFFHKLSKSYNDRSIVNYFLSNFVSNTNLWVGDITGKTGDDHYKLWSKKIEALHYYYEQDIDYILERKIEFDDIFTSKNGQHPPILKMFLSKRINFETFIILDDILSFSKQLNKNIKETVLWPKLYDRMIRYKPFLIYNVTKYKKTLRDKLKEI